MKTVVVETDLGPPFTVGAFRSAEEADVFAQSLCMSINCTATVSIASIKHPFWRFTCGL